MKNAVSLLVLVVTMLSMAVCFAGDVYVNGYYKNDGTYVQGYHRSTPDDRRDNNYNNDNNNPYK